MANDKTIGDVFKEQHPEAAKNLEENSCWDYKIYGPISFDDLAVITVTILWKQEGKWHNYRIVVS